MSTGISDHRKSFTGKSGVLLVPAIAALLLFWGSRSHVMAATPYKANGRLSVSNGKVVNSKGKAFVIKGVSTHGLAWYPQYVNKKAFRTLRDQWGVNTIRLALYTAEYNGYCTGGNKKDLKKLIDNGVRYATDLGMYVIIDWHILSDGNPLTYQSQADSFFKEIAAKYSGHGNVMFEICNEPNGGGGSWENIKSYANKIIKTIRKVNKKAIIIVGTPTWSQDVDQAQANPIKDQKNIAYALHFYAGTHKADLRAKLESVLKKKLPVVVTEFGISPASGDGNVDTAEGDKWISLLDQYRVGRICWNLSNKNETSALIKSSCEKTSGWGSSDLSASGKWLVKTYTGKAAKPGTTGGTGSTGSSGTSGGTGSTGGSGTSGGTGSAGGSGTSGGAGSAGSSGTSGGAGSAGGSGTSNETQLKSGTSSGTVKIKASISCTGSWETEGKHYAQYRLILKNTGSRTSAKWGVTVKFKKDFQVTSNWCGSFQKKKLKLTVTPLDWNKTLAKKDTTEIGFIVCGKTAPAVKAITVSAS